MLLVKSREASSRDGEQCCSVTRRARILCLNKKRFKNVENGNIYKFVSRTNVHHDTMPSLYTSARTRTKLLICKQVNTAASAPKTPRLLQRRYRDPLTARITVRGIRAFIDPVDLTYSSFLLPLSKLLAVFFFDLDSAP